MSTQIRSVFWLLVLVSTLRVVSAPVRAIEVAFIVADVGLSNPGDILINEFLLDRAYEVTLVSQLDDPATTLAVSDAADLTIVAESVGTDTVGSRVKDTSTPVITAEAFLYDEMGYSIAQGQEKFLKDITIVEPDHALAAGLPAGDVAIYDFEGYLGWGEVGGDVTVIATAVDAPDRAVLFVYEEGAVLDDGSAAPAMRIGLPHNGLTLDPFPNWTAEGEALFAAAIDYALGSTEGQLQLQAGDANMDCLFDTMDIVQVSQRAKYLTGESATWGDGDWDGAPGGSAVDKVPPAGNGQFDQLDIVAALSGGKYLEPVPYCAEAGFAAIAIPEPSTFFLLAFGLSGGLLGWRQKR